MQQVNGSKVWYCGAGHARQGHGSQGNGSGCKPGQTSRNCSFSRHHFARSSKLGAVCLFRFHRVMFLIQNVSWLVIQVCWREISRYNEMSLASAGNVISCHILIVCKCALGKWDIFFSVCVLGGGSFQANQFIGGRQATSWSHKNVCCVLTLVWNCLVELLWHFLCRVAHTMEWLGI